MIGLFLEAKKLDGLPSLRLKQAVFFAALIYAKADCGQDLRVEFLGDFTISNPEIDVIEKAFAHARFLDGSSDVVYYQAFWASAWESIRRKISLELKTLVFLCLVALANPGAGRPRKVFQPGQGRFVARDHRGAAPRCENHLSRDKRLFVRDPRYNASR